MNEWIDNYFVLKLCLLFRKVVVFLIRFKICTYQRLSNFLLQSETVYKSNYLRFEKVERDHRKKAEKEAYEQRRQDLETLEVYYYYSSLFYTGTY